MVNGKLNELTIRPTANNIIDESKIFVFNTFVGAIAGGKHMCYKASHRTSLVSMRLYLIAIVKYLFRVSIFRVFKKKIVHIA